MNSNYVSPGHRLSDEDWAQVTKRAAEVRAELAANAAGGSAGPGGIVVDLSARSLASKKYFGVSGIPTQLLVLHSAECPLQAGYAISLTEWFSGTVYPQAPIASWQRFVDPVYRVRAVPDELGAWHASEANPLSIGWEQAGYARFTREEWLTPDGRAQLELLAFDMAEVARRDGIPPRWLTTAEVRDVLDNGNRSIKGFCFHRQIDPETRTDPGGGYPADLLMDRIKAYLAGEELDVALTDEDAKKVALHVWAFRNEGLESRDAYQVLRDIASGNVKLTNQYGTELTLGEQLGWVDKNLNDYAASLGSKLDELAARPVAQVELDAEDVQALADQLTTVLAPNLVTDLAKRLLAGVETPEGGVGQ